MYFVEVLVDCFSFFNGAFISLGCGYAKNQAVKSSSGEYLCFLDADDEMMPERIEMQLNTAIKLDKNTLVGSQVYTFFVLFVLEVNIKETLPSIC